MASDFVEVSVPLNCSVSDLIQQVNIELSKKGQFLTYTDIPSHFDALTVSEFLNITNGLVIKETVENNQENSTLITKSPTFNENESAMLMKTTTSSPLSTCHCCKKRKNVVFECEDCHSHRFCEGCLEKLKCNDSNTCPVCKRLCQCSRCRNPQGGTK